MVTKLYSKNTVSISKLEYIELFEKIGNFKSEIIDIVIESLISNPAGTSTIGFDNFTRFKGQIIDHKNQAFIIELIKFINKLQFSTKFMVFLRFILMNMYKNANYGTFDEITKKQMIFDKFQEIPIRQFLSDLKYTLIHTTNIDNAVRNRENIGNYLLGLDANYQKKNLLEIYYISMCYKYEPSNIQSINNNNITVDFNTII